MAQGIISRIGSGETTNIWRTNWLPRDGQLWPLSCPRPNALQLVKELIDPLTLGWDHAKLQQFLTPMDAEVASSIPLPMRRYDDFWAWHYEKSGLISVRSAYRILVQRQENVTAWLENKPGRSDVEADEQEWSAIWQLKVPSKIRVFCGDRQGTRSQQQMYSIGDIWQSRQAA